MKTPGQIIYGGSFNPLHIGHLRLALECCSMTDILPERLQFLPCANPPHKSAQGLLPFELRCSLINNTIKKYPNFSCNRMEAERKAPSYTWITLDELRKKDAQPLYFLMGSQDFALLTEWWRGLELPDLCTLLIAPRELYTAESFLAQAEKFWGHAILEPGPFSSCMAEACATVHLKSGAKLILLPAPHLAISASRIRKMWLCGKNLDYLVPGPALDILNTNAQAIRACWQETGEPCSM